MDVMLNSEKISSLTNVELFNVLTAYKLNVGPVIETTRSIYENRLKTHLSRVEIQNSKAKSLFVANNKPLVINKNKIQNTTDIQHVATISAVNKKASSNVDNACCVCLEDKCVATLVHLNKSIGHTVCCLKCAMNLKEKNELCPICRETIDAVIKVFS